MIPRLIHFVWVGRPVPDWAKENMRIFAQINPDYQVKLHGEDVLLECFQHAYERVGENPGHRYARQADVLRVCALLRYGGWYFDCDFLPFRPLDDLYRAYGHFPEGCFLTHAANHHQTGRPIIANGLIAATLHSPMLALIATGIMLAAEAERELSWDAYGPQLYTTLAGLHPGLVRIGEMRMFYPIRRPRSIDGRLPADCRSGLRIRGGGGGNATADAAHVPCGHARRGRPVNIRPFLITGCGRSGTRYTADLFRALRIPTGWEQTANPLLFPEFRARDYLHVLRRRKLCGDSNWLAVPYLKRIPRSVVVFHQIRHPLKVIRSLLALRFFGDDTIRCTWRGNPLHTILPVSHLDGLGSWNTAVERCADYWLRWNLLCEMLAKAGGFEYYRYRFEDLVYPGLHTLPYVLCTIGKRVRVNDRKLWPGVKNQHQWFQPDDGGFEWDDLPCGELRDAVREKAVVYGYTA